MLFWNTVEFPQMTLRLVPEVLNAIDMVPLVSKEFRVVDATMLECRYVEHVVAAPAVRIDDAVRHHLALNDGV